jgi:hypothetical protein
MQRTKVAAQASWTPSAARLTRMFREWFDSLLGRVSPTDISPPPDPDAPALFVVNPDAPKPMPPAQGAVSAHPRPESLLIGECTETGRATAQATAGVKRDAVVTALTALASSIVQKYDRDETSPEHRRRKVERVIQIDEDVEQIESDRVVAEAVARKRRAWLIANPRPQLPALAPAFIITAIVLIMLSVAPVLFDAFGSLDEPVLQAALAFAIGLAVGRFAVTALLPHGEPLLDGPEVAIADQRYGLANGLAGSFFLMRLAFIHSLPGFLLATGGLILEIVVIRVVRGKATGLLKERSGWVTSEKARREIEAEGFTAEKTVLDLGLKATELKGERNELLAWIENERRPSNRKELEALAVNTLVGAYTHELLKQEGRQRRNFKEIA